MIEVVAKMIEGPGEIRLMAWRDTDREDTVNLSEYRTHIFEHERDETVEGMAYRPPILAYMSAPDPEGPGSASDFPFAVFTREARFVEGFEDPDTALACAVKIAEAALPIVRAAQKELRDWEGRKAQLNAAVRRRDMLIH